MCYGFTGLAARSSSNPPANVSIKIIGGDVFIPEPCPPPGSPLPSIQEIQKTVRSGGTSSLCAN